MLKESLIGWGGINFKQEKIILDNQKVYTRTRRGTRTDYVRGPFYKWVYQKTENNVTTTYEFYTQNRNPNIGDYVFGSNIGVVYQVVNNNQIKIYSSTVSEYDPIVCTYSTVSNDPSQVYGVTTYLDRIYPINIDDSATDRYFDIEYTYKNTTENERFYFDKDTQCLVRMAMSCGQGGIFLADTSQTPAHDLRHVMFELYDPNTGELLDRHSIWGYSKQVASSTEQGYIPEYYFPNCSQGLYGVYLNGIDYKNNALDNPTILLYNPRLHRVFDVDLSEIFDVTPPGSAHTSVYPTIEKFLGAYNTSSDNDDLHDIVIGFSMPDNNMSYSTSSSPYTTTQKFYELHTDLTKNPVEITTPITSYYNVVGNPILSWNAVARNLNSENYVTTNDTFSFYQVNKSTVQICFSCDDAFFDSAKVVNLIEPEHTNTKGYIISLVYEGVGNTVYFRRSYRDENGNLTSINTSTINLQSGIKYYLGWAIYSNPLEVICYDTAGNPFNAGTNIYASSDTSLVVNTQDDDQYYKFAASGLKIYLMEAFMTYTSGGLADTQKWIGAEYNPFVLNTNCNANQYVYQWDHYLNIPSAGWSSAYSDSNNANLYTNYITYTTNISYTDVDELRNISLENGFIKNGMPVSSYALKYVNYTTKNNQMGSSHEGFYLPKLITSSYNESDIAWKGDLYLYREYGRRGNTGTYIDTIPLTDNTINATNTDYWPRLFTGPKCKINATTLDQPGLFFELNGVSYYKNNSEIAHGGYIRRLASSNVGDYFLVSFAIISETEEGAKCYTSEDSTPKISGTLTYKGKTYYYYEVRITNSSTNDHDDIYNSHNLVEYYLLNTQVKLDTTGGELLLAIIGNGDWTYYISSTLSRDEWTNSGNYRYKLIYGSLPQTFYATYSPDVVSLSLYDMSDSTQTSEAVLPLTVAPCSENILILTSKSSSAGINRYLNAIISNYDFSLSKNVPLVSRVDCYRNTQYLSDVSTNTSTAYYNGGTNVPPICVTSGEAFDVTLTISPDPSDATVTFSTGTVSGNSCTVPAGTSVTYTVSKTNYQTRTGTVSVGYNQTISVPLSLLRYTLTVYPDPSGSTVTFSTGTVSGNSCTVDVGTSLTYTVSNINCVSQSETIVMNSDQTRYPYLLYKSGLVLLSTTSGSSSFTLRRGNRYYIDIVGGGAGAWNGGSYHNKATSPSSSWQMFRCISGGSGAYIRVYYDLSSSSNHKTMSYSVGSGGAAECELDNRTSKEYPNTTAGSGGNTIVYLPTSTGSGTVTLTAGGGVGGNGRNNVTPAGGTYSDPIGAGISISSASNGNAGNYVQFTDQNWHNSAWVTSPYGGDVGKGGNAGLQSKNYGSIKQHTENPGTAGLVKVTVV